MANELRPGILLLALFLELLTAMPTLGETTTPHQRYLFLVETSRAMQRRSAGMLSSIETILASRCGGQLRDGDLISAWSFNEGISKGIPFEPWSTTANSHHLERLNSFVTAQKFENVARFDNLVPGLQRLVNDGDPVCFIFIASGETRVEGTPFDEPLNRSWSQWQPQVQKARMPILTALCASSGKYTGWSAAPAPWALEFPLNTNPPPRQ